MELGSLGDVRADFPTWFFPAAAFAFGLLWGSFLNVVIYRLPREMSVVHPASHCPGCGKPIAGYDNVPILSYLVLRGRARCCGTRMSPRYPLVELIGGMLSLAIVLAIIDTMPPSTPALRALVVYGADFTLCLGLVAAAFIDAEHMFLPDSITIGGTVLGIATATVRGLSLSDSLLGAVLGFAGVFVPFIFLYKGLLGRTGMGMGDAKLLALAGAWFGWPGAVVVLFGGAMQGTLYAAMLAVFGVKPKLPVAVAEELAELRRAAAEGDEEAARELAEDPLSEDEDDAFLIRGFKRIFGIERTDAVRAPDAEAPAESDVAAALAPTDEDALLSPRGRHRVPFGPFLVLACLEVLFSGESALRWIRGLLGFATDGAFD